MPLDADTIEILAMIGAIATEHGHHEHAWTLTRALYVNRPDCPHAALNWAIANLHTGDYECAIDTLRHDVLATHGDNELARCFLGSALDANGQRREAEIVLKPLLASDDPLCRALAAQCLNATLGDESAPPQRVADRSMGV